MRDLKRFEKRLEALTVDSVGKNGGFNALGEEVVMGIMLLARLTGRGTPQRGARVLPADWRDREEMRSPIFDKVRRLGEQQWDIHNRQTHSPLKPEYAKECADKVVSDQVGDYKPLSFYEGRYSAYPHVTEEERTWCPREAFWAWFDQQYPDEPRCEL